MIAGIGHDLCDIGRVERMLAGEAGAKFLRRILTDEELELAAGLAGRRLAEFAAGRFAAKEAAVKALGCGIGASAGFRDVSILRAPSGKPVCRLSARSAAALGLGPSAALHVSITHERQLASAVVVLET
ncbi:holo-ACP synthase [Paenibacillus pasadenensis]|uniref:Holo-[acyl-carrier-protein] synthase n=1 Tax=Paenibacillus pasadenensis TaxID=217090 RepID=A0A2N5N2X6_9BACL|nr:MULTISPECIES: holo-ACP synthase [Paenibacillus]PLT44679.1 Holo-[acyl-carrier protein] synthase [Paenibacillus pasadenensis]QGG55154.1 holo-[acyl-carrier-protein] synthase [Paenibacillus sp. B01]